MWALPAAVFLFGLGSDQEVGEQASVNRERESPLLPAHTRFADAAITYKRVLRNGAMQDEAGASIALECFSAPPARSGERTAFGCAGLASQSWDPMITHINAGLAQTREHSTARLGSFFAEGPYVWKWRPGIELRWAGDSAGNRERSALAGVVYTAADSLQFDAGWRVGRASGEKVRELRLGLKWTPG